MLASLLPLSQVVAPDMSHPVKPDGTSISNGRFPQFIVETEPLNGLQAGNTFPLTTEVMSFPPVLVAGSPLVPLQIPRPTRPQIFLLSRSIASPSVTGPPAAVSEAAPEMMKSAPRFTSGVLLQAVAMTQSVLYVSNPTRDM